MPLRVIVWAAVSTKGQVADDKHSLPLQEADGRAWTEANGGAVVDVLNVPGHSRRYKDFSELARVAAGKGIDAFTRLEAHWQARDFDVLWVRAGDRFARTQSLHARITEEIIDAEARIYSQADGWIDRTNYRMFTAMQGFNAAAVIDQLVTLAQRTKDAKIALGQYVQIKPPWSHRVIRNELGRFVRLVPADERRPVIEDAARLVVAGVPWQQIETELYARFGHTRNGRPFPPAYFRTLFYNPFFWGHSARRFNSGFTENGQRRGLWAFDAAAPGPPGGYVVYGTHAPALDGELAAALQAEMRRRQATIRGRTRPGRTHTFAGLLVCADCGSSIVYAPGSTRVYWRCPRKWEIKQLGTCNGQYLKDDDIRAWFDTRLRLYVQHRRADVLAAAPALPHDDSAALDAQLASLQDRARRLIVKQAAADPALAGLYDEQLADLAGAIRALQSRQREAARAAPSAEPDRARALGALTSDEAVDALWRMSETEINQFLHAIMGRRRLQCRAGRIVDIIER